jgi:hypothetical protein
MSEIRYCFSVSEEEYHGEFESRETAIEAAVQFIKGDAAYPYVWVGRIVRGIELLRQLDFSEQLLESMEEALAEDIASDEDILSMTPEKQKALNELILDFIGRHATFARWGVDDVRKYDAAGQELKP